MPVVIGGFVSAAVLVVCGLFWGPVQKRFHPISHSRIVMGISSRMIALLHMRVFLGWVKIMSDYS